MYIIRRILAFDHDHLPEASSTYHLQRSAAVLLSGSSPWLHLPRT